MIDFLIGDDGDLVLQDTAFAQVDGEALLRQKMRLLLSSTRGDWFLNVNEGLDLDVVLQKNPSEEAVRDEVGRALLPLDLSVQFSRFSMHKNGRTLMVDFELASAGQSLALQQVLG